MTFSALYDFAVSSSVNCLQASGEACETGLPVVAASSSTVQIFLQILFGVLAVVAVVIITIAGIRFMIESTNPQETARARNTIVFAVIGLLVAISGQVIVSFVLDQFI